LPVASDLLVVRENPRLVDSRLYRRNLLIYLFSLSFRTSDNFLGTPITDFPLSHHITDELIAKISKRTDTGYNQY
jgi:hypothetical protein